MPQDFLGKDCTIPDGVTLDDFRLQFCDRCLQGDCARSIAGTSRFDKRITTWEADLFTEVPKMDPRDERYTQIHAKRFTEVRTKPIPEVGQSAWVDPRDLDESSETTHKYEEPAPVEPALVEPAPVEPPPLVDAPEVPPPTIVQPPAIIQPQAMNTPNRPGQMLKGTPKPVVDPWEPKGEPAGEGEIVEPGTRIRFGH